MFGAVPKRAVKLPNVKDAQIDRIKIVDYLLAVDHPERAGKASRIKTFERAHKGGYIFWWAGTAKMAIWKIVLRDSSLFWPG